MVGLRSRYTFIFSLLLFAAASIAAPLLAQQSCTVPSQIPVAPGQNLFTPAQESDLGDVITEQFEKNFRVIEDDEISEELNRVAQRVLSQMPSTGLRFRIYLVDMPVINAFSFPGGRVYVTRKLVAFLKNEDELAGVLAHEIGHIITHQSAMTISRMFHEGLGISSVGDHADIFAKYNQLLDSDPRKQQRLLNIKYEEQTTQLQADQVALLILGSAGYSPLAYAEFFDRFAETKGKTGSWFSNAFGFTAPDQKRLQEIRKEMTLIPQSCRDIVASPVTSQFKAWQIAVVGYSGLGRKDILQGLIVKRQLASGLRNDLSLLDFSPDGHYALAQDESSIYIISIQPFQLKFRIDAPQALEARFSPDSESVVFADPDFRIEKWSVSDETRTSIHDVSVRTRCIDSALSPDGKSLACVDTEQGFRLYDTESGAEIFDKKQFFVPQSFNEYILWFYTLIHPEGAHWSFLQYSPDGKYVIAARGTHVIALSAATHDPVPVKGALKDHLGFGFTFVAENKILGLDPLNSSKSVVAEFPSGDVVDTVNVGDSTLHYTGCPGYVRIAPIKDHAAGLFSIERKIIFLASDRLGLDACKGYSVNERVDASIALTDLDAGKVLGILTLPQSSLANPRVAAVSPDLRWLALSSSTRGAVWDLSSGDRSLYVRGFRGAFIDSDANFFADFPKYRDTDRTVARTDLHTKQTTPLYKIPQAAVSTQHGRYNVVRKPNEKNMSLAFNVTYEVRDAVRDALLWSQSFPKDSPSMSFNADQSDLLFWWRAESESAKSVLNGNPELKLQSKSTDFKSSFLLEARDASSGKVLGDLIVGSTNPSFRIASAIAVGDWVGIIDTENRTMIYSLSQRTRIGAAFGNHPAISTKPALLAVENQPGHLQLYSLPAMEKISEQTFSSPVAYIHFNQEGNRMLVVTSNQTAYFFDTNFNRSATVVR